MPPRDVDGNNSIGRKDCTKQRAPHGLMKVAGSEDSANSCIGCGKRRVDEDLGKNVSPVNQRCDPGQPSYRCHQCSKGTTYLAKPEERSTGSSASEERTLADVGLDEDGKPTSWNSDATPRAQGIAPTKGISGPEKDQPESESDESSSDDEIVHDLSKIFGKSTLSSASASFGRQPQDDFPFSMSLLNPGSFSFGTPQTFATARSSLSSFSTAPSGPRGAWALYVSCLDRLRHNDDHKERSRFESDEFFALFLDTVFHDIFEIASACSIKIWSFQRRHVAARLNVLHTTSNHDLQAAISLEALADALMADIESHTVASSTRRVGNTRITHLKDTLLLRIYQFASTQPSLADLIPKSYWDGSQVFSSEWLNLLQSRGITMDVTKTLDWSGRGQHVEYTPEDEDEIPLTFEKNIGHSSMAIVDSVKCRRIRLARKKIRCNKRFRMEDAVMEVKLLQNLRHRHIIQVVGTYRLNKDLSILLYPVAQWNLEEFLEHLLEGQISDSDANALLSFVGCLANTIHYIHGKFVKHMDIKPLNLLIRRYGESFRIYLADFGISRAYKSVEESFTGSPTSFSPIYAAPEVASQEIRGYPADIFSLGCVFMEILAVLQSTPERNELERLEQIREQGPDHSYHANIDAVCQWVQDTATASNIRGPDALAVFTRTRGPRVAELMLQEAPEKRPTINGVRSYTEGLGCKYCTMGPEPFEAAEDAPWLVST